MLSKISAVMFFSGVSATAEAVFDVSVTGVFAVLDRPGFFYPVLQSRSLVLVIFIGLWVLYEVLFDVLIYASWSRSHYRCKM